MRKEVYGLVSWPLHRLAMEDMYRVGLILGKASLCELAPPFHCMRFSHAAVLGLSAHYSRAAPLQDANQICSLASPHSSAFVDISGDCLPGA